MYSFEPTEEQQMLVEAVGKYATNDLRAAAREAEEGGELPGKVIGKGWEIGLLQASIPEAYGGFGERSAVTGVLAVEAMAFGDLAGTPAVMTPSLFATPILFAGSEEQKQTYLPNVTEGNWSPFTAALIENVHRIWGSLRWVIGAARREATRRPTTNERASRGRSQEGPVGTTGSLSGIS